MIDLTIGKKIFKTITKQKAFAAVIAMFMFMVFFPTNFFSTYNLLDLMNSASIYIILAFGITLVIIGGGIDLSIGGSLTLGGIVAIMCMNAGMPIWLSIICAVLSGALIGVINGYLVVYQKCASFIITLGMGMVLTGVAQQLTDAHPISPKNIDFMMIANESLFNVIPNLVIIMLIVFVIVHVILRYTQFGRNIYAIGGDYEVAKYSGISVRIIQASTYVLSGAAAAFAGVMLSSQLNTGSSVYGDRIPLVVISAVVVGGTSLAGGVGGAPLAMIGYLVFGVMENAMNMLGINPYVQDVLRGVVVVTILSLDSYGRKRKREDV
jgi:ribose transport system permease protein